MRVPKLQLLKKGSLTRATSLFVHFLPLPLPLPSEREGEREIILGREHKNERGGKKENEREHLRPDVRLCSPHIRSPLFC